MTHSRTGNDPCWGGSHWPDGAGQVVLRCRWRGFALQVCVFRLNGDANRPLVHSNVAGQAFFEATEKGIYYTSLRESTLHNNPPEFSYSDERSTLRRMFAF